MKRCKHCNTEMVQIAEGPNSSSENFPNLLRDSLYDVGSWTEYACFNCGEYMALDCVKDYKIDRIKIEFKVKDADD